MHWQIFYIKKSCGKCAEDKEWYLNQTYWKTTSLQLQNKNLFLLIDKRQWHDDCNSCAQRSTDLVWELETFWRTLYSHRQDERFLIMHEIDKDSTASWVIDHDFPELPITSINHLFFLIYEYNKRRLFRIIRLKIIFVSITWTDDFIDIRLRSTSFIHGAFKNKDEWNLYFDLLRKALNDINYLCIQRVKDLKDDHSDFLIIIIIPNSRSL